MKKTLCTFLLLCMAVIAFGAPTAVIKEIQGKVKIKLPGQVWEAAVVDMEIKKGTVISTSFNSEAVLDLGESYITVQALTRMTLEELLERDDTIQTDIYLKFGKVSAEVKSSDEKKHDFKLKSPISTAAVRGTKLVYDMFSVWVESGFINFLNLLNQKRTIQQGGGSFTIGFDLPDTMKDTKNKDFWVSPTTGDELYTVNTGPDYTGTIVVEW